MKHKRVAYMLTFPLTYKSHRLVVKNIGKKEQYRVDINAVMDFIANRVSAEYFKDKKPTWKYKRLNYEETYMALAFNNKALQPLVDFDEFIKKEQQL